MTLLIRGTNALCDDPHNVSGVSSRDDGLSWATEQEMVDDLPCGLSSPTSLRTNGRPWRKTLARAPSRLEGFGRSSRREGDSKGQIVGLLGCFPMRR
jgi:hypothetical protein